MRPIIGTNWIKCWMQGLGKDTDMRFAKKRVTRMLFRLKILLKKTIIDLHDMLLVFPNA